MVSEPLPQNFLPNSPKPILASLYPFSSSPSPLVPSLPNYLQPKSMPIAKTSSPNSPLPSPTATTTPPSSSTPSPTPPPGPTSSSTPSYPMLTPSSPLPKMPPTSPTPPLSTSIPATATAAAPAPLCGSSSTIRRNSPEKQEVNSSNFKPISSSSNRSPGIRPNVSSISSTQVGLKPVLEYYCNLCLDNCSYQRYQCNTLRDYDLCLSCFAREGLGLRSTPLDFSYIEDDERQFDVLEYWCNHCFANCTDEHYRSNKFLSYHLCPTCVTNGEFELGLTLRDFILIKAAEEDSLPAIKASKRDDGRRTTSDHMKKSSSIASFRIDNISRSKGASSDASNRSHEVLIGNGSSVNVLHIDPEVTSLEHETHLQTPFANPANRVTSLVAFLTSVITPRVAANCARASLGVLTKGNPRLSFISSHNEDGSHGAYANLGHQNIPYAENDATSHVAPEHVKFASMYDIMSLLPDKNMYTNYTDSMSWLEDTNVLEMIVDKFSSSDPLEVHANAAEVLCTITRYAPPTLATKICSLSFIGRWFHHALEESRLRNVLVHPLSVCMSLLDPKRLVTSTYQSYRSQLNYGSLVSANSNTVDGMLDSLDELLKFLDVSSFEFILPTTYGSLQSPLGKHRLKIVEFIPTLLTIGSEAAEKELIRLGAIKKILNMLFEYPFNNFLHHHVENIIGSCLETGAATGIASGFNAVVAGCFLAIEAILQPLRAENSPPFTAAMIILASVISSTVSNVLLGERPAFIVPTYELKSAVELHFYLILGMFYGVISVVFTRLVAWFKKLFEFIRERFGLHSVVCPALGGLGIGLRVLKYPGIPYWGFTNVEEILHTGNTTIAQPQAYALVGMAATVASVCLVPLTSVLLLFELTKGYRFFLPLMVVHTRRCSFALARGSSAAEINPSKWLIEALEQSTPRSLFQSLSLKEEEVPLIVIQENDGKKYLKQNVGADQITIWFEEYTDGSLTPNSWLFTKHFIFDSGGRHRENILGLSHVERGIGGGFIFKGKGLIQFMHELYLLNTCEDLHISVPQ